MFCVVIHSKSLVDHPTLFSLLVNLLVQLDHRVQCIFTSLSNKALILDIIWGQYRTKERDMLESCTNCL